VGCSRMVGLIFAYTIVGSIGLVVRMLSALLQILLSLIVQLLARLLLLFLAWIVISLTAITSPLRSANTIVDRINDRLLQERMERLATPFINSVLRFIVLFGFALGWSMTLYIGWISVQWLLR
jgi:hypothetical protein